MNHKHEAHYRKDIVISHWHLIVMLWVVVSGIVFSVHAHALNADSISQHVSWIKNCSQNPVFIVDEGLIVYVIDVGAESGDVIDCLDIQGNPDLGDGAFVIFPSPIDIVINPETYKESPMPEALIRSGNMLLVAAGTESDHGVMEVQRISGDTFIVKTSYWTHDRNYLVFGSTGSSRFLANGNIKTVNGKLIAYGMKSYFKEGGAIWLDALIDLDGNVLDIVTPDKRNFVNCMSRDELSQKTFLDLSRVKRHRVCYEY
ncbi:MAG: hypothetical protein V3V49_05300 [Candidatus Krumholzibacteria bacterium]